VVIGLVLAVVAVALVALPFRRVEDTGEGDSEIDDLLARRETAYQLLRDLDLDFQAGKLSEDDYRPMRVQGLAQAAEVVAQIDAYEASAGFDEEEQDETDDATGAGGESRHAPAPANDSGDPAAAFCSYCGTPRHADDAFCRKCGRKLKLTDGKRDA